MLLEVVQRASDEYTKKTTPTTCKVLLFVGTYTIIIEGVDTTKSVGQFKKEVEEQSFKVKKMTVSGPPASWRYYCKEEEALDVRSLSTYVDEEEEAICFHVREPKRKRPESEEKTANDEEPNAKKQKQGGASK